MRGVIVLKSDFKYNFITQPNDALKCLICLDEVANDPWQHDKCGKLFCKMCLEQYGKQKSCPNCREEKPRYFEDTRGKREIQELSVKCDNLERSCSWEGTVATLNGHVASCVYTLLTCPNKCTGKFMRKNLPKHLVDDCPNRNYECRYCGKKGTYNTIIKTHDKTCAKKPVNCTNSDCNETVARKALKRHRDECPFTEVQCKFSGLGCGTKRMRKDMTQHEMDDTSHLHMALETVAELQQERNQLQAKVEQLDTIFKLTDYEDRSLFHNKFVSPHFYTSPGGYRMVVAVKFQTSYEFGVYVELEFGDNDNDLKWPFVGAVHITLLNQLENKNHIKCKVNFKPKDDAHVGTGLGFRKFTSDSNLAHDLVKNTQYLKDDTLYFKVSADVPDHKLWLECTRLPSIEPAAESTDSESTTGSET